jgi:hypothetical protein
MEENVVYGKIWDETLLETLMKRFWPDADRMNFEKKAVRFLFYSPEELREYIRLCDINIGRGYGDPHAISLRELALTREVKFQLYGALKEHVRRQRGLDTLDFALGEYELDRTKVSNVGKRSVADLDKRLGTGTI